MMEVAVSYCGLNQSVQYLTLSRIPNSPGQFILTSFNLPCT